MTDPLRDRAERLLAAVEGLNPGEDKTWESAYESVCLIRNDAHGVIRDLLAERERLRELLAACVKQYRGGSMTCDYDPENPFHRAEDELGGAGKH